MKVLSFMPGQQKKELYLPSILTFKGISFWDLSTCVCIASIQFMLTLNIDNLK